MIVLSSLARFVRERVIRRILPGEVTSWLHRNDRPGALHRAWGHVFTNVLDGAYYEFGVYRGDSFRFSYLAQQSLRGWAVAELQSDERWRREVARRLLGIRRGFYAFDTFSGMPSNSEGSLTFVEGSFRCSLEEFSKLNRAAGIVEGPDVRYFVGTFADVARLRRGEVDALEPAAIVNIDADLYESARDALALVGPKLQQGTVLLMDDWNAFEARRDAGERRALVEFLSEHPEIQIEPWFAYMFVGQAFIVHRTSARSGIPAASSAAAQS